jgi:hypothetical protein
MRYPFSLSAMSWSGIFARNVGAEERPLFVHLEPRAGIGARVLWVVEQGGDPLFHPHPLKS